METTPSAERATGGKFQKVSRQRTWVRCDGFPAGFDESFSGGKLDIITFDFQTGIDKNQVFNYFLEILAVESNPEMFL